MKYSFEDFLAEGTGTGGWLPIIPPRPLRKTEERLLCALLRHPFPGHEQLQRQVPSVRVVARGAHGDPSFKMSPNRDPALAALVVGRVPVEGWGRDTTGRTVQVLLHVIAGYLGELEILGTSQHPSGLPTVATLQVY